MTSFRLRLTLFACGLAFVVVALGAFTRLVDAGLGCPDWPGCYGHLTWPNDHAEIRAAHELFPGAPVDTDKTWPEMVHRYFAGTLGLVILVLAVAAMKDKQTPAMRKLPWALVVLVIIQALFGMWTVTLKLWPQVVTAHLLGGFTTLALLWLMFLRLRRRSSSVAPGRRPVLAGIRILAFAALVAVSLQIALGGWTSSNYAALACIDLPTCHGEWLPAADFARGFDIAQTIGPNYLGGLMDNEARTAIHLSHRVGAVIVTAILLLLAFRLSRGCDSSLRVAAGVLVAVLVLQISLGVTNILAALPLPVAVAHNGVGALLLLTLVTINYQLHNRSNPIKNNDNRKEV